MTGRPSKLTPDVQRKLTKALAGGNTRSDAARLAGISRATLFAWLARGRRQKSGQFLDFLDAVKKAETEAAAYHVAIIHRAARQHWQASAWWLERRRRRDFGRTARVEHTGKGGQPIQGKVAQDLADLLPPPAVIEAFLESLGRREGAGAVLADAQPLTSGDGQPG
jgi:hypothetical protein